MVKKVVLFTGALALSILAGWAGYEFSEVLYEPLIPCLAATFIIGIWKCISEYFPSQEDIKELVKNTLQLGLFVGILGGLIATLASAGYGDLYNQTTGWALFKREAVGIGLPLAFLFLSGSLSFLFGFVLTAYGRRSLSI